MTHKDHGAIAAIFKDRAVKIVRTDEGALELTLDSTDPAVMLTIRGEFVLTYFGNAHDVRPTATYFFTPPGMDAFEARGTSRKGVEHEARPVATHCTRCEAASAEQRVPGLDLEMFKLCFVCWNKLLDEFATCYGLKRKH